MASSTPASQPLPAASSGGSEQVITGYDDKGFTTIYTVPAGVTAQAKSYDSKGFLVTAAPTTTPSARAAAQANLEENAVVSSGAPPVPSASSDSSALRLLVNGGLVLLAAFVGVVSVLL